MGAPSARRRPASGVYPTYFVATVAMDHRSSQLATPTPAPPAAQLAEAECGRLLELVGRLTACGTALRRAIARAAAPFGLTDSQAVVLWLCQGGQSGGSDQSSLVRRLAISAAQVSGLVEALRQRGLLESRRDATDRRRQRWQPTAAGAAVLQQIVGGLAPLAAQVEAVVPSWAGRPSIGMQLRRSVPSVHGAGCPTETLAAWLDGLARLLERPQAAGGPRRDGASIESVETQVEGAGENEALPTRRIA
jgi:DNA-binding MarR family transcriptional regulator